MDDRVRLLDGFKGRLGQAKIKDRRIYVEVPAESLRDLARHLFREKGCRLSTATALEVRRGLEILYHFSHDATGTYVCPRLLVPDLERPVAPSIAGVVKGAEWIEREMAELFGIVFEGHPRPGPLLTRDHPEPPDRPLRLRRRP